MANNRLIARRLLALKEDLEKKNEKRAELRGELKSRLEELKNDYGLKSVEEAEKHLEAEKRNLMELEKKINEAAQEISEMLEGYE